MTDINIYEPFRNRPYTFKLKAYRKGSTDNYCSFKFFSAIDMYKRAMLYDADCWTVEMLRLTK